MATERAKAADRNKAADFKVAEARRLLELAEQPVHPRSRLALQARAAVRSRSPLWASLGNDVEPLSAKVLEAPKVSFEG